MSQWSFPVDPCCEQVREFGEMLRNDPMATAMYVPLDEIRLEWEKRHQTECERCRRYGVENVGVE